LVTLDALLGLTELLDDVGLINFGVMVALLVGAKGARRSQLLLFRHVLDLPLVGGVLLLPVSYQHPKGRLPIFRILHKSPIALVLMAKVAGLPGEVTYEM
jgi:hypothetical protein